MSVKFPGKFREMSGKFRKDWIFPGNFQNNSRTFSGNSGKFPEKFRENSRKIPRNFREIQRNFRKISGGFPEKSDFFGGEFQTHFLQKFREISRRIPGILPEIQRNCWKFSAEFPETFLNFSGKFRDIPENYRENFRNSGKFPGNSEKFLEITGEFPAKMRIFSGNSEAFPEIFREISTNIPGNFQEIQIIFWKFSRTFPENTRTWTYGRIAFHSWITESLSV